MTEEKKHPTIKTAPVESSQISEIGHEGDTLCVKFKSGGCYHYAGVSAEKFEEMRKAESLGKFLGQHIKGKHEFVKVS